VNGLRAGSVRVRSRYRQEVSHFSRWSRPAVGPTQPPIQWIPGPFPDVKRPGFDKEHTFPSTAEVKNVSSKWLLSLHSFMTQTGKNLIFYLYKTLFLLNLNTFQNSYVFLCRTLKHILALSGFLPVACVLWLRYVGQCLEFSYKIKSRAHCWLNCFKYEE
jgi:hypothetical protein